MSEMLPGYDVSKAAQAAAFFALKSGGGINVLKLSKLLYLAEREAMERYDSPMFFDNLVSMPDGPVVSVTLNLINGELESSEWNKFVAPRTSYNICVSRDTLSFDDLADLSKADVEVLADIWMRFASFDRYALRDWTHKPGNIPEWKDPEGSSFSIRHQEVYANLGKADPKALENDIAEYREIKKALARI